MHGYLRDKQWSYRLHSRGLRLFSEKLNTPRRSLLSQKTVSRFPESRFHFLKPDLQPLSVAVKPGEMGF
jgi:hypothetical protein